MSRIVFLGSGGGRWSTIFQQRATGGWRLELENDRIHVDPGPGAIVRCREFGTSPRSTTAVIVSHCHLDHFNDAEIMVEAMSMGRSKGIFAGSKSVVEGHEKFSPILDQYHRTLPERIVSLEQGSSLQLTDCTVRATKSMHEDPTTVGLQFDTAFGKISYIADTEYFDGLAREHAGSSIAIVNMMRPAADRIPFHLCTEDAITLLNELRPKLAFFQHFGLRIIRAGPENEVRKISDATGVQCIAVRDGYRHVLAGDAQAELSDFGK